MIDQLVRIAYTLYSGWEMGSVRSTYGTSYRARRAVDETSKQRRVNIGQRVATAWGRKLSP